MTDIEIVKAPIPASPGAPGWDLTRLRVPDEVRRPVAQWDTIVRREDRGHRLGMLLKLENLAQLEARFPGHPSVMT
ncbi:hypothetical protein, partial [Mesorhizobium japonicum]|uniref:hypothetical protein n=1 Tax=Mesorhizobium japonicum TaxID=2066070 RepID=UPI003B5C7C53